MRLLIINYEFPPVGGGAGKASFSLAKYLARMGVKIAVLTSCFRGLPRREKIEDFEVYRIPALRRRTDRCSTFEMATFLLSGFCHISQIVREFKPQASYAFFGLPCGPLALYLKRIYRIPYVVSIRGGDVPGFLREELRFHHMIFSPIIRHIWNEAAHVVSPSKSLAMLAHKVTDLDIKVIPNIVDNFHFESVGTLGKPIKIITVGRLTKQKNIECLLNAISHIRDRLGSDFILEIAGDGPERQHLEKQAHSLGLQDGVNFLGWLPKEKLLSLYHSAHIFVFPSIDEGMSNVILEALSCGLPIVASDILPNSEVVFDGKNGLLFPVRDSIALSKKILALVTDDGLRNRMGLNGLAIAKNYVWDAIAEDVYKLCSSTIGPQ